MYVRMAAEPGDKYYCWSCRFKIATRQMAKNGFFLFGWWPAMVGRPKDKKLFSVLGLRRKARGNSSPAGLEGLAGRVSPGKRQKGPLDRWSLIGPRSENINPTEVSPLFSPVAV